ncbi:MAG: hypothetical protein E5V37_31835, partial [Mesorhizobium sp.]
MFAVGRYFPTYHRLTKPSSRSPAPPLTCLPASSPRKRGEERRSPFVPIFLGDRVPPRYLLRVTEQPRLAEQNAAVLLPEPFV